MSTTAADLTHGHGHDHDHGHDHNPYHQHHFTTMEQQADASKIGMWLFLVTEILLFGGLFVGFGIYQGKYPLAFMEAHHHLDRKLGFLNTVLLLVSSWTMVMGVLSAQRSEKKKLVVYLVLTIMLASGFLVVKFFEYEHKIHDGLLPGKFYSHKGDQAIDKVWPGNPVGQGQKTFFSFYFMMTGLHGFHILVGILILSWLAIRASRGDFSSAYYTPIDLAGLYWHLVDLIWIYLFPLLYLIS
jgi:cytochrome c oxidase subunit 3